MPAPIELKRGMGSSTTDRKFCSTYRGGACSRSRSAAAAAALNDHRNLAAFDTFAAVTRAHEARRFPGALRRSDLLEPPGRRCGCWRRRHLRFSEIVGWQISGSGPTMELRRSMLTSASPARSGGAGAGADRAKARYGVIDNRSEILQHLQRRRLLSLAQRCGGCGTERSSEFGSVRHFRCRHARAE